MLKIYAKCKKKEDWNANCSYRGSTCKIFNYFITSSSKWAQDRNFLAGKFSALCARARYLVGDVYYISRDISFPLPIPLKTSMDRTVDLDDAVLVSNQKWSWDDFSSTVVWNDSCDYCHCIVIDSEIEDTPIITSWKMASSRRYYGGIQG